MTPVTPRYAHSALRPDLARIAGWIAVSYTHLTLPTKA